MSSEEAAASLFGPEDSSSDPFTALGTEFNQETSDDLFTGVTAANSAHSGAADLFDSLGEHSISSEETENVGQNQPGVRDYGSAPDPYTPVYNGNGTPEAYGTYGVNAQNNSQSYYGAITNNASYNSTRYLPSTPHDPYTPPQPSTFVPSPNYQPTTSHASGFTYPGQTSIYDTHMGSGPYAPPQPVNPAPYTPHNTYTPTTSGKSNISVYEPPYAIPQAPSFTAPLVPPPAQANLATVPAPPPPTTVPLTRPKISNAYDPPFPVTSYSRRNVSGRIVSGSGQAAPTQSAYGAYQSPTPPPPPPAAARIPPVLQTHTPPTPAAQTHAYTSVHTAPPTRTQPVWMSDTNAISVATETSVATTYARNVPPPPSAPEPYIASDETATQPQWVSSQAGNTHPGTNNIFSDNRVPPTQPGAHFFSQYNQQESQPTHHGPVSTKSHSPLVLLPSMSANPNEAVQHSPTLSAPLSPQRLYNTISASHETNPGLGHVSNSRQSPRPLSTPPPVHGLSHSPRASPDLHRSSLVRSEQLPRPRTSSPGLNGSIDARSSHVLPKSSVTKPKTGSVGSIERISSPESSLNMAHDRYAPRGTRVTNVYGAERTGSPSSFSTRSSDGRQSTKPQHASYLPPVSETSYVPPPLSQEPSSVVQDPYAPSQNHQVIKSSSTSFGYGESPYNYNGDLQPPQEVIAKPTITPYAPSPSLVGANDPLGRTSARVPVVTFGFGGKFVTCFHDASTPSTGFDVALSSRISTKVQIQNWKNLIPESALDSATTFPGPLYGDPGPPSTGIMKVTATAQAKTKKTQVTKYLSDRSEEIAQSLGYLHNGSVEKRMAEGKLVLVKLLKIMVENDGRLLGTPQLDSAVRVALLPRLEGLVSSGDSGTNFTTTADTAGLLTDSFGSLIPGSSDTTPISVTTLRATSLDKIEEFLLRGERRQAYHYALDERLWAHAMVIASSINKEAWKEVVSEFIRSELGAKVDNTFALPGRRSDDQTSPVNGREGLRVAYSLFSGQGATAVQELVPKNLLAKANGLLPIPGPIIPAPSLAQATPRTPNFAMIPVGTKIPDESLSKWAETVAMMISSPLTNDASATLTALGDQLLTNGWIEAAHVCFLLSPQTSPLGGVGNPASRIVLLGSKSPSSLPTFSRDPDSIILTEILEYALASATVPKSQEPYHGVPHLQAYRLIRAFAIAEAGDLGIAGRYCEAITASLARGSIHFTPTMLEQLKGLADQLSGVSHSDKPNSWMAGKISKPSLDTIGGWLEGSFTKLVTGGSDVPASPQEENRKSDTQGFSGPFAHYNTISSTTSSARSSPQPTFVTPAYALPARTSSPMSNKTSHGYGIDRSSSAMEPLRRKESGAALPQALSASASMTSFPPIHTQWDNYNPTTNGYSPDSDLQTPKPSHHDDQGNESNAQEVTWWGSTEYGDVGKTPTATRFQKVENPSGGLDSDGLFSPMSNQTFSIGLQSSSGSSTQREQQASYEDDDDLGLGNSSNKRKSQEKDKEQEEKPAAPAKVEEKKPETQQSSGRWFGRWWRRSENTSGGPVKASLGEESSFYYDKDLKRWVNKKAGGEAPKEAPPPPPPPRAQTASPGMMGPKPPGANGNANGNGPGMRSASAGAVDLSASPPNKPSIRVRSSLAPPGLDSAPPTPTGTRLNPGAPPPSRPRSQASQKKNIRNRYVDVFAQEGAGA